ncbi:hypothetical protein LINPERHAP1_LOCUS9520, partial [Linum perenne]
MDASSTKRKFSQKKSSTKRNPSYSLPTRTHVLKGRRTMDMEQIMDYLDTGANDRHNPKTY